MTDFHVVSSEKIAGGWCIVVERSDHWVRIGVEVWTDDEGTATTAALHDAPAIAATLQPGVTAG